MDTNSPPPPSLHHHLARHPHSQQPTLINESVLSRRSMALPDKLLLDPLDKYEHHSMPSSLSLTV